MRLEQLINVGRRDEAVPDRLRIHDHRHAMLALIEAACRVDADAPFQSVARREGFEPLAD